MRFHCANGLAALRIWAVAHLRENIAVLPLSGRKERFFSILRERWINARDCSGLSKHLKHCWKVLKPLVKGIRNLPSRDATRQHSPLIAGSRWVLAQAGSRRCNNNAAASAVKSRQTSHVMLCYVEFSRPDANPSDVVLMIYLKTQTWP